MHTAAAENELLAARDVVGLATAAALGPTDAFAASLLGRLYDVCQTGAGD